MSRIVGCPREGDPMDHIEEFISGDLRTISGFKIEGLQKLKDIVLEELAKREPSSNIVLVDRDWLSDNRVDFARDMKKAVENALSQGGKVNFVVYQDVPVINWQTAFEGLSSDRAQVYMFTSACLQVPCCYKLIGE